MKSENLGLGVMINMLGGNVQTIEAVKKAFGQKILSLNLVDDRLTFGFATGKLHVFDDGQSCCESRYMSTSDNLNDFVGGTLKDFAIRESAEPSIPGEYGEHKEMQFLIVKTTKGHITLETHNHHNGYYGGFAVVARWEEK